jgi:hypothetical protein
MADSKSKNKNLHQTKASKKDEFYTQLTDIEKELKHYRHHFAGKVVYCNCDDPRVSNFFHYFFYNFEKLGLKKLITTCYKNQNTDLFSKHDSGKAIYLEYEGDKNANGVPDPAEIGIKHLKVDGDFRSQECIELLKQADIVVINPPFSLFREYVAQLIEYGKKFLIIGNGNAISYKEIFKLIKENKIWLCITKPQCFLIDDKENFAKYCSDKNKVILHGKEFWAVNISVGTPTYWFTNLEHTKRNEELILYKTYNPEEYPKYDNYDAIEVSKVADIPMDYDGVMGVPITFLDKYNPEQFEILGNEYDLNIEKGRVYIKGKRMYGRIFIKHKKL